jgi:hypothetical protein
MIVHESKSDFAWTAAAFPGKGYVWFALKDPRVLRSTILWISNGGRHFPPWNGRHVNVMGLEEVTSYFHYGLSQSVKSNPLSRKGIPTSLALNRKIPLVVNYIMAVAAVPRGFERVKTILPGKNEVTLISPSKQRVTVPLDTKFLYERPMSGK